MKYIILSSREGMKLPFIFPNQMIHRDMAAVMMAMTHRNMNTKTYPLSAGFVEIGLDTTVHGRSETLGLDSRVNDAAYLALGEAASMMPESMIQDILKKAKARSPK